MNDNQKDTRTLTITFYGGYPLGYDGIEEEYRAEAGIPPEHEVTEEELKDFVFDVLAWHFQSEQAYRNRDKIAEEDAEEERRLQERVQEALDRGDYLAAEVLSGLHYAFDETEDDDAPGVSVKNGYPEEVDEDEEEVVYYDDPFC